PSRSAAAATQAHVSLPASHSRVTRQRTSGGRTGEAHGGSAARPLTNLDQAEGVAAAETRLKSLRTERRRSLVSTTTLPADPQQTTAEQQEAPARSGLTQALLANRPARTVIAAAIAFLYLVWATVEILSRYVGPLPKLGP